MDWPTVVLLLGVVGLSLGTVCFTIWAMGRTDEEYASASPQPSEGQTAIFPP